MSWTYADRWLPWLAVILLALLLGRSSHKVSRLERSLDSLAVASAVVVQQAEMLSDSVKSMTRQLNQRQRVIRDTIQVKVVEATIAEDSLRAVASARDSVRILLSEVGKLKETVVQYASLVALTDSIARMQQARADSLESVMRRLNQGIQTVSKKASFQTWDAVKVGLALFAGYELGRRIRG